MVDSGIIFKSEWHKLFESLLKTVKFRHKVLLLLLDVVSLFLLEWIDIFLKGEDYLFAFIEFLFGLVD
jgi:hypothetical protein